MSALAFGLWAFLVAAVSSQIESCLYEYPFWPADLFDFRTGVRVDSGALLKKKSDIKLLNLIGFGTHNKVVGVRVCVNRQANIV